MRGIGVCEILEVKFLIVFPLVFCVDKSKMPTVGRDDDVGHVAGNDFSIFTRGLDFAEPEFSSSQAQTVSDPNPGLSNAFHKRDWYVYVGEFCGPYIGQADASYFGMQFCGTGIPNVYATLVEVRGEQPRAVGRWWVTASRSREPPRR